MGNFWLIFALIGRYSALANDAAVKQQQIIFDPSQIQAICQLYDHFTYQLGAFCAITDIMPSIIAQLKAIKCIYTCDGVHTIIVCRQVESSTMCLKIM